MAYRETVRVVDPTALVVRVRHALRRANGNVSAAARALGVSRRTLSRWLVANEEMQEARDEARDVR